MATRRFSGLLSLAMRPQLLICLAFPRIKSSPTAALLTCRPDRHPATSQWREYSYSPWLPENFPKQVWVRNLPKHTTEHSLAAFLAQDPDLAGLRPPWRITVVSKRDQPWDSHGFLHFNEHADAQRYADSLNGRTRDIGSGRLTKIGAFVPDKEVNAARSVGLCCGKIPEENKLFVFGLPAPGASVDTWLKAWETKFIKWVEETFKYRPLRIHLHLIRDHKGDRFPVGDPRHQTTKGTGSLQMKSREDAEGLLRAFREQDAKARVRFNGKCIILKPLIVKPQDILSTRQEGGPGDDKDRPIHEVISRRPGASRALFTKRG